MVGSIWSCPAEQMLRFPMATMIRFCHNHGLLQITRRPQWRTVRGGARHYVARMLESIPDTRLLTPVQRVRRLPSGGAEISTDAGSERFDAVVMACHGDQSLALLADASVAEREVLGSIRYHSNRAVLHTDTRLLPKRQRAWAAWNYERAASDDRESASVCLHYLLNRLQPLPFSVPVIVSLNPVVEPAPDTVHGEFAYSHPIFDTAAVAAQARLAAVQGERDTWFCGAWTGYGFHEDGLASGLAVAEDVASRWAGREHSASGEAVSA
jgi:predicted NAD/FAD-binding protein